MKHEASARVLAMFRITGETQVYEPVRTTSKGTFHVLVVLYSLLVTPDQEEHVELSSAQKRRARGSEE